MMSELCQLCGKHYEEVYQVPNEIWERIKPEYVSQSGGLLCVKCADKRAREKGIKLYWEATDGGWESMSDWIEYGCDEIEVPPKTHMLYQLGDGKEGSLQNGSEKCKRMYLSSIERYRFIPFEGLPLPRCWCGSRMREEMLSLNLHVVTCQKNSDHCMTRGKTKEEAAKNWCKARG